VVNAAIERYHRAGALHCASLMVDAPHVEEAVEIARRNPSLCVGLHLALCEDSPAQAGLRYAFSHAARRWLPGEIRRQFDRFRALGFPALYWDGHTHLHLHPIVLANTLPIAQEHGFRFTRLVREPGPPAILPWIFQGLSRAAIPRLQRHGIAFADRVFGLRHTGCMTSEAFHKAIVAAKGITEIYFHPGVDPAPAPEELAALL
jgi:chitin disaccharide deacetylase